MKDKSKVILVVAIFIIVAIIAYVCLGIVKGKQNPIAIMQVSYLDEDGNKKSGTVKIELNPDVAPESVANFTKLANNGFYNGLTFHRLVSDFMIQGGDKLGNGTGSALLSDLDKKVQANTSSDYTYSIKGEFASNGVNNSLKFEKGVIGMARSDYSYYGLTQEGYNSASTQFFIVTTDNQDTLNNLNQSYASFGRVIEGYEIIEDIANIYATEEGGVTDNKLVVDSKGDEILENGKIKVSITTNKELNSEKIPEGWSLSEENKNIIYKEMDKDSIEKVSLIEKDGATLEYIVIAGKNNVPYIDNMKVDTFGADYGLPQTINFDKIQKQVQSYQEMFNNFSSGAETEITTQN